MHSNGTKPCSWGHAFVYDNKFWFLNITARGNHNTQRWALISTYNAGKLFDWTIMEWDGTNTPIIHQLTSPYDVIYSTDICVDQNLGTVDIFCQNLDNAVIQHCVLDLSTFVINDIGTAYPQYGADYNDWLGFTKGHHARFNTGDVTGVIDPTQQVVDTTNRVITIGYYLYGTNSDTADVAIEYNTGTGVTSVATGWKNATQKSGQGDGKTDLASSPSGISHTFVHDVVADLGESFLGTVQYRIRVTSQTRN
jgi:hypothetical protein